MSKVELSYAVLMKPSRGYKEEGSDEKQQLKPVAVMKGSLLVYLDPLIVNRIKEKYDRLVNYKVVDGCQQSELFLFVTDHKSSIFDITTLQKDLLLGVKHLHSRIEVLQRLEWVESLKVDSEVYVTINTIPTPVKGVIRYIGGLTGEEGRKFGVELMVLVI